MDARLIVQVAINLVDNAAKYTPEGAQIRIHTGKRTVWWWCRSLVTGSGILDEQKSKVFDMFYTGTKTGRRTDAGAWDWGWNHPCRSIIRALGEKYGYQTIAPGGCIYITLPAEEVTLHESINFSGRDDAPVRNLITTTLKANDYRFQTKSKRRREFWQPLPKSILSCWIWDCLIWTAPEVIKRAQLGRMFPL